jgi:hypothetical protein
MKRLVLAAAVLAIAACKTEDKAADTIRTDTSAPALAPSPVDSAALRDSIAKDSIAKDSAAKATKTKTKS